MKLIMGRSNKLGSYAIRLFTWSRWSHCGVIMEDTKTVIESSASEGGVVESSLSYFKKRYPDHIIIEIPSYNGWESRLRSQLGSKYDWGAIFRIVLRGDWSAPNRWICSELIAWASGVFNSKYVDRVTPQDLMNIAKGDLL